MDLALAPSHAVRRMRGWPLVVILALAPLWLLGVLDRNLWTPDEPREADMAWRMASQSDRTIPELAGVPFLEKPPLSYWLSAGSQTLLGESTAAARLPNLLYALVATLAIGALAFAEGGAAAAVVAALVAGSSLLAWRVTSWLAPDAESARWMLRGTAWRLPWLSGTTRLKKAALLYADASGRSVRLHGKERGRVARAWTGPAHINHLGASLVGAASLGAVCGSDCASADTIGPWILAVERMPRGTENLRALFWNNLAGRFAKISTPEALDYTRGHKNWPGRYLVELPLSLLPWTLLVVAALRRAWDRVRANGPTSTAWRFAVAACLPLLSLLSLSATARDVYAAPLFPGIGLLVALWATERRSATPRLDDFALRATYRIVAVIAFVLAAVLLTLALAGITGLPVEIHLFVALLTLIIGVFCWRSGTRGAHRAATARSVAWVYTAYAVAFTSSALLLFPVFDRWQNLGALARQIHIDTADNALALLQPDETTIAMLDYRLRTPFTILSARGNEAQQRAVGWFQLHGSRARILVQLPGHAPGELTPLIERWHRRESAKEGVASVLEGAGVARTVAIYQLPHSRRYALLAPPGPDLSPAGERSRAAKSPPELEASTRTLDRKSTAPDAWVVASAPANGRLAQR